MMRSVIVFGIVIFFAASAFAQATTELEQILAPFDSGLLRGTRGASWAVELRVRNESDEAINLFPGPCSLRGTPVACWTRIDVAPRQTNRIDHFREVQNETPSGLFFYVPKLVRDRVHFSLFVASQSAVDDPGVSVPVVPISAFRTRAVIVGVPVRLEDRRALRLYHSTWNGTAVDVTVIAEADERIVCQQRVVVPDMPDAPHPLLVPRTTDASACLSEDAVRGLDFVTVVVVAELPPNRHAEPFWPMISVTSNVDHRVAIFVPGL